MGLYGPGAITQVTYWATNKHDTVWKSCPDIEVPPRKMFFFLGCACMRVYVRAHVCYVHMHIYMWKPKVNSRCRSLDIIFGWDSGSLDWKPAIRLAWVARLAQGSSCPGLPSARTSTCHQLVALMWGCSSCPQKLLGTVSVLHCS